MDDRAFWLAIRRALLIAAQAIEARYPTGHAEDRQRAASVPRNGASPR